MDEETHWIEIIIITDHRDEKSSKSMFFSVFDHHLAQIACPELSRGVVMVISNEKSNIDSPRAQNHRKTCFLYKMSDFKFFA